MSKRSFRRLAAVTGAALAIGSMAPALAAHVSSGGSTSASVDTIGVTDVTDALPPVNVSPSAILGTAGSLAGPVIGAAQAAPGVVVPGALTIVGDAVGLGTGLLGTTLSAAATGTVTAGLGGVSADLGSDASSPVDILGSLGSGNIVGDSLGLAGGVAGLALPAALQTAGTVQTTAGSALGTVTSLPAGLSGVLNSVLGTSANLNILANSSGSLF